VASVAYDDPIHEIVILEQNKVETFVKRPVNRHCEEWSDEAIFCFQLVATTRLPRFARNDTFYESVKVEVNLIYQVVPLLFSASYFPDTCLFRGRIR